MLRQAALLFLFITAFTQVEGKRLPMGQLSRNLKVAKKYGGNTEITDLEPSGKLFWFTHDNGRLNATRSGYYYIYAQAFFETHPEAGYWHNRVHLMVNGHREGLLQAPLQGKGTSGLRVDYGNVFTAIITRLKKGDVIHLKTQSPCNLWMTRGHTFFGAFKLR